MNYEITPPYLTGKDMAKGHYLNMASMNLVCIRSRSLIDIHFDKVWFTGKIDNDRLRDDRIQQLNMRDSIITWWGSINTLHDVLAVGEVPMWIQELTEEEINEARIW